MNNGLKKIFFVFCIFNIAGSFTMQLPKASHKQHENQESNSWLSKKTMVGALKLGSEILFDYVPAIYSFGRPVLPFIGYQAINRIKTFSPSYTIAQLRERNDYTISFLNMAADTIRVVGLDESKVTFCDIRKASLSPLLDKNLREELASNPWCCSMDQHGVVAHGDGYKTWPLDQQQYALAHELIHEKEKHLAWKAYGALAMPVVTALGLEGYNYLAQRMIKHCAIKYNLRGNKLFKNCVFVHNTIADSSLLHALVTTFATYQMYRYCEIRADIGAALALQTAQGGINFFNRCLIQAQQPSWYDTITLKDYHPAISYRIAYLTALQSRFDKERK